MFANIPLRSMPSSMSLELKEEGRESCSALRAATTPAYKIWQALCTPHSKNQEELASTYHIKKKKHICRAVPRKTATLIHSVEKKNSGYPSITFIT